MFESLSQGLEGAFRRIRGLARITETNTREAMRDIRTALLEADVNYKVVKDFTERCLKEAEGEKVLRSVSPGQQVVKIVYDELVQLMGPVDHSIPFVEHGVTPVMLVGLQGSGKTTTAGKLAKYFQSRGKRPGLVAADVQRPAAVEQLRVIASQLNVPFYSEEGGRPPRICERSVKWADENGLDVAILDTAGRLHIDAALMTELKEIAAKAKPSQIYLVCDAMTGQDAVNSAKEFNDQLSLDGVILTKLDGDARGGAALSIKAVTGKPVKFIGVGEHMDRLEEFHPERMADRILGMGDVRTLVEKAQQAVDVEQAAKLQEKIRKRTLTLEDFLKQLQQVKKIGPLGELLGMIPGMKGVDVESAQGELPRIEGIINSMTPAERRDPDLIDGSRRRRIGEGSATSPSEVNQLLKQFKQMKKFMKRFADGGGPVDLGGGVAAGVAPRGPAGLGGRMLHGRGHGGKKRRRK